MESGNDDVGAIHIMKQPRQAEIGLIRLIQRERIDASQQEEQGEDGIVYEQRLFFDGDCLYCRL